MNAYFVFKTVHILSATVLFGTGLGIAFFKSAADRSGNPAAIRVVSEKVVWANWIFTLPAICIQLASGLGLAHRVGYSLGHGWVAWSLALFVLAGACWIPVAWLQIRMRAMARELEHGDVSLAARYRRHASIWFWLGVPAFGAVLAIMYLMVARPF